MYSCTGLCTIWSKHDHKPTSCHTSGSNAECHETFYGWHMLVYALNAGVDEAWETYTWQKNAHR